MRSFRRPSERIRYRASRLRPLESTPERDAETERGRVLPFVRVAEPTPADAAPEHDPSID